MYYINSDLSIFFVLQYLRRYRHVSYPAIATIKTPAPIIMDKGITSEGASVSEIQSLSLRVEEISRSLDWWNAAMIWGLAIAAIAAVFVVLATRIIVTRTGQLSIAQDGMTEAKDRQLQSDLKTKDVEIGTLRVRADIAEGAIAAATEKAEDEKMERLKLEAQIAPRRLTREQKVRITENCGRFRDTFTGKRVKVVSYSLDMEGFVFSEQIVSSLRASGMVVDDDSMSVVTPVGTFVMGINVFGSDSKLAKEIADAIGSSGSPIAVSFVATNPIAGAITIEYGAPPSQAIVLVGLKPPEKNTIDEIKRTMPRK